MVRALIWVELSAATWVSARFCHTRRLSGCNARHCASPSSAAGQSPQAARSKANEIIDQAHQRANQLIDAAKSDAIAEGNRQKALAEAEIEAAANRAKEDLRKQVSALAVSGAEKLLKREIDASAHKALIDDLAAQL